MNEEDIKIVGNKESKYIIYTADGTEFYLEEFSEYSASGVINGDVIKFHPENIIAVRTRKDPI